MPHGEDGVGRDEFLHIDEWRADTDDFVNLITAHDEHTVQVQKTIRHFWTMLGVGAISKRETQWLKSGFDSLVWRPRAYSLLGLTDADDLDVRAISTDDDTTVADEVQNIEAFVHLNMSSCKS